MWRQKNTGFIADFWSETNKIILQNNPRKGFLGLTSCTFSKIFLHMLCQHKILDFRPPYWPLLQFFVTIIKSCDTKLKIKLNSFSILVHKSQSISRNAIIRLDSQIKSKLLQPKVQCTLCTYCTVILYVLKTHISTKYILIYSYMLVSYLRTHHDKSVV